MDQQRAALVQEAEEVIRRVRGVAAVRVEASTGGGLGVIHVLGEAERSPKVIAMDVASALAAELGVQVDPRQIRVAAMRPHETAPPPLARLKFVGLTLAAVRQTCEVTVHLEERGMVYEGKASGANTTRSRLDLAAQAAVRAVEAYLRVAGLLHLEGTQVARVGDREVALTVLTLSGPDGEETLSGCAVVRDDPREALVRAVLGAVNRPVTWMAAGRAG